MANTKTARSRQSVTDEPQPTTYYIDNAEFEELIVAYKESRDPVLMDALVTDFFYVLTYNIIKTFAFKLIDWEDALQEGTIVMLKKVEHFDPARGKAFNFFTTLCLNHFRGIFKSARNYEELKAKFLKQQALSIESPQGRKIISFFEMQGDED